MPFRLLADVHGFVLLGVLCVHVASNRLLVQGLVARARVLLLRRCVDLLRLRGSGFTAHQEVSHHVVLRRLAHARTVPVSLLARRVDVLLRRRHLNCVLFGQHLVVVLATRLQTRGVHPVSSVVALGPRARTGRRFAVSRFGDRLLGTGTIFDQLLHQLAVVVVAEVLVLSLSAGLSGRLLRNCLL